jgi:hypothetical protein
LCDSLRPRAAYINQRRGAPMRPIDLLQVFDLVLYVDIPGALT